MFESEHLTLSREHFGKSAWRGMSKSTWRGMNPRGDNVGVVRRDKVRARRAGRVADVVFVGPQTWSQLARSRPDPNRTDHHMGHSTSSSRLDRVRTAAAVLIGLLYDDEYRADRLGTV